MPYRDKEAEKARNRAYYQANKEKIISNSIERNIKRRAAAKEYVKDYLESHACVDCGEDDIIVLEFDHINREEKFKSISFMVQHNYSIDSIKKEIEKCEVRCANCHRRKSIKNKDYLPVYLPSE